MYQYPYERVLVQDDIDYVVAAHHDKQENQLFELTEAVKALDDLDLSTVASNVVTLQGDVSTLEGEVSDLNDFKDSFDPLAGQAGKVATVKVGEDGFEYTAPGGGGGGYTEPGLLLWTEPERVEQFSFGFDISVPLVVIMSRVLLPTEEFRLRLMRTDVGPTPLEIDPGIVVDVQSFAGVDFIATYVYWDIGAENIIPWEGYSWPPKLKVKLLVRDYVADKWVDGMTIDFEGPPY